MTPEKKVPEYRAGRKGRYHIQRQNSGLPTCRKSWAGQNLNGKICEVERGGVFVDCESLATRRGVGF